MIRSCNFSIFSKILSMSTLAASFRKFRSKLSELLWWQSLSEAFSAINPIWRDFKLVQEFTHAHLISEFQGHPIKAEWVMLMTRHAKTSHLGRYWRNWDIYSGEFYSILPSIWHQNEWSNPKTNRLKYLKRKLPFSLELQKFESKRH